MRYLPRPNSSEISPDRVLATMLKGSGKDFDPILLKVFINILGVYPVGVAKIRHRRIRIRSGLSEEWRSNQISDCIAVARW
jgi:HD-GYP domain-containing protein (c-di-GMP phosphodiesterase class II)